MIADEVRDAFQQRDLDALAGLLAEDVTWGDPDNPDACHNRAEVIATYRRALDVGAAGEVVSVEPGQIGVVVHLRLPGRERWQLFVVRDCRIVEIRGYDDADSASSGSPESGVGHE